MEPLGEGLDTVAYGLTHDRPAHGANSVPAATRHVPDRP